MFIQISTMTVNVSAGLELLCFITYLQEGNSAELNPLLVIFVINAVICINFTFTSYYTTAHTC